MTKIDIVNLELIIPDDYQQFLVLFHISDEKLLMLPVKLKVRKNGTYWSQNPF